MERHLLLSNLIKSVVYINNKVLKWSKQFGLENFSTYSPSSIFLFSVDVDQLLGQFKQIELLGTRSSDKHRFQFIDPRSCSYDDIHPSSVSIEEGIYLRYLYLKEIVYLVKCFEMDQFTHANKEYKSIMDGMERYTIGIEMGARLVYLPRKDNQEKDLYKYYLIIRGKQIFNDNLLKTILGGFSVQRESKATYSIVLETPNMIRFNTRIVGSMYSAFHKSKSLVFKYVIL